jgi:hypothetical protein
MAMAIQAPAQSELCKATFASSKAITLWGGSKGKERKTLYLISVSSTVGRCFYFSYCPGATKMTIDQRL